MPTTRPIPPSPSRVATATATATAAERPFPPILSATAWLTLSWLTLATLVLLLVARPAHAQDTPPEEPTGKAPPAIVPPEGPGDSWGYDIDEAAAAETETESKAQSEPSRPTIERARLVGEPGNRLVRGVRRLREGVGRAEWSRQGDWIAYDKPGDRGVRALYIGSADADSERCLTCESWDLRSANVLAPTWHPGGQILVALVQGAGKKLEQDTTELATPARGLHSDLWAFSRDGREAWQLTQVVRQGGAILDPVFSQEGHRLAWTERYDTTVGEPWGAWQVRVAEFEIKRQVPRLGAVRTLRLPWPAVAMIHGFTDDDRGLWLSVGPAPGGRGGGMQAARLDLETGQLERLPPLGEWDDLVLGVPRSDRRVFVSDRDLTRPRAAILLRRSELWFASASGRRQERLTFFNDPESSSYLSEAWIADLAFSPSGEQLLLQVLSPGPAGGVVEALYLVDLAPELVGTTRSD